jgi:hypothetical protein
VKSQNAEAVLKMPLRRFLESLVIELDA